MRTQDAKFILQSYRPGGEDANDPQFAEALNEVKRDPELAAWFAEQVTFDASAGRALKQVTIPLQLREIILVGQRVIKPLPWWKRPRWLAMAAAFLVFLGLGRLWFESVQLARFGHYLDVVSRAAATEASHLDIETKDSESIRAWLAGRHAPTNIALPAGLRGVPAMGCRVLEWRGNRISMVCFVLDGSKHVDLFVAARSAFANAPEYGQLKLGRIGLLTTASWSRANEVYTLIGPEDEQFFRERVDTKDLVPSHALQIAPRAVRYSSDAGNTLICALWQ